MYTYENLTEIVFAYVCIKTSLWHQSDYCNDNIPSDFNFCVCAHVHFSKCPRMNMWYLPTMQRFLFLHRWWLKWLRPPAISRIQTQGLGHHIQPSAPCTLQHTCPPDPMAPNHISPWLAILSWSAWGRDI